MSGESTRLRDAVIRPAGPMAQNEAHSIGISSDVVAQSKFVLRSVLMDQTRLLKPQDEVAQAAPREQEMKSHQVLIAVSPYRPLNQKIILLQRWIGRVERVKKSSFVATVS